MAGKVNTKTRAPASKARVVTESTVAGGGLALIVQFVLSSLGVEVPTEVLIPGIAFITGAAGAVFSFFRDLGIGGWITGIFK